VSRLSVVWVGAILAYGCAAQQSARSTDTLFETPEAQTAKDLAPDLYARAEAARARASQPENRRDESEAQDHVTEAELWLSAAVAESERIQLERRRMELQREEEQWAKQLARDQEASQVVASDISRYEARRVALLEAERVAALGESTKTDAATLDAVLTRVRLNLALAEALGATDAQLRPLQKRTDAMALKRPTSSKAAASLLRESEALLGKMRRQWPEPRPGASIELVETAQLTGFSADRTDNGVLVRSERFYDAEGRLSNATVTRFTGLLAAFPHGPVACQVAVPEVQSRAWSRRVAALVDRLRRVEDPSRVSTSMVETESIRAGTVQCTFVAYRQP
jgi:hypothetical protein